MSPVCSHDLQEGNVYNSRFHKDWKYFFTEKGETAMANGEVLIPVQDWDSSVKCPKCEGDGEDLKTIWKTGGNCVVNGIEATFPADFEYLRLHCDKCGFEWVMQTADADERLKAQKEAMERAEEERDKDKDDDKPEEPVRGHGRRVVKGGA